MTCFFQRDVSHTESWGLTESVSWAGDVGESIIFVHGRLASDPSL